MHAFACRAPAAGHAGEQVVWREIVPGGVVGGVGVVEVLGAAGLAKCGRPRHVLEGRQVGLAPVAGLDELAAERVIRRVGRCHLVDNAELAMARPRPLCWAREPGSRRLLWRLPPRAPPLWRARGKALPREGAELAAEIDARAAAAEFAEGRVCVRHGDQVAGVPEGNLEVLLATYALVLYSASAVAEAVRIKTPMGEIVKD